MTDKNEKEILNMDDVLVVTHRVSEVRNSTVVYLNGKIVAWEAGHLALDNYGLRQQIIAAMQKAQKKFTDRINDLSQSVLVIEGAIKESEKSVDKLTEVMLEYSFQYGDGYGKKKESI